MKLLPLNDWHDAHGAKMGEFAGFRMPLYYGKPIEEHHAVRRTVGVFDISHMGQFLLSGAESQAMLNHALANDVKGMHDGQALYSPLCNEQGGVLDDLIVYQKNPAGYRIIVNAATKDKDLAWLQGLTDRFGTTLVDVSPEHCLFAVQGPEAFARLDPHCKVAPSSLGYYTFTETEVFGFPVFMARTGYTGEPGCELAVKTQNAQAIWERLTGELGMAPIGLAARDTLRLEACMHLYGHELREDWNPLESGLGWAVKLETPDDFIGKAALQQVKDRGLQWRLCGVEVTGRGIPREGYPVLHEGQPAGEITSGALSPTTGRSIALARVKDGVQKIGTALEVEIRGKRVPAEVVRRPFYKNPAINA